MGRMGHAGPETLEENAEGQVKSTYEDIKRTLRVPTVTLVFRRLAASYPDYLELAWRQLHSNAQTVYFERCSDDLRRRAVEAMAQLGTPPDAGTDEDVRATLRVFHYINPKLLLGVAAIRAATNGQAPKLQDLPAALKRQIPTGVPDGAATISLVDPETADERAKSLLNDVQQTLGLPLINSDYRALVQWPGYLERAWGTLKPVTERPEYRQLQRDLRRSAEEAAAAFPYRMDLTPHTLRHAGQSEQQIDGIRSLLDSFSALLPGLVAHMAFFSVGVEGAAGAAESPFPLAAA